MVAQAGAPYIGPFTGAEFLREPDEAPTAVNIRASYFQETDEMVERLIEDLGIPGSPSSIRTTPTGMRD